MKKGVQGDLCLIWGPEASLYCSGVSFKSCHFQTVPMGYGARHHQGNEGTVCELCDLPELHEGQRT